jgi:hypothetical protein
MVTVGVQHAAIPARMPPARAAPTVSDNLSRKSPLQTERGVQHEDLHRRDTVGLLLLSVQVLGRSR